MIFRRLGLILVCAALLALTGCELRKGYRKVRMPSFTAAELKAAPELKVVSAIPKGEIEAAGEAEEILVSFSDAMVALGADSARPDFPLLLKPDVPGRVTWLGTKTLSFHPDTTLPVATEFTATIPLGAKSQAGAMLKQEYTFKFTTQRPRLLRTLPRDGEKWVGRSEPVLLGFNLPMDPRRAQRFVNLVSAQGRAGFRLRRMTEADQKKLAAQPDRRWYAGDFALDRTLVLEPAGKYGTESKYTITLAEGLRARNGNLGLKEQASVKFETERVFAFLNLAGAEKHAPEEPLAFTFSNPVSTGELAKNISFVPAVEIPAYYTSGEYSTDIVRLSLDLKADTDYTVTISGKLKDRFGNRLGRDIVKKLHTIDYATRVSMPTGHSITESYGTRQYPVTFLNPDSVELTMAQVSPEEWIRLSQGRGYSDIDEAFDGLGGVQRIWKPATKRNRRQTLGISLDEVLNRNEYGCVALRVSRFVRTTGTPVKAWGSRDLMPVEWRRQSFHAFTQVTGIGITGKFGPEGELLFVTDLKTAQPVAGALVELKSPGLNTVWSGRTDRDGLVEAPGWLELGFGGQGSGGGDEEGESEFYGTPQLWAFARTEEQGSGDLAFIGSSWGTGVAPYELGVSYDWSNRARAAQGFLFTEKGLYHSGDTVHLKGIVRDRRKGQWVLPEARNGTLVITDSRSENVVNTEVALSRFGSLDYTFKLKPDAPSGSYSAVLKYGRHEFPARLEVAAYRPAEFEVKVTSPKEQYTAGDKFAATVLGKYLFGAMMSGEKVNWTLTLRPYHFSAAGFEDFDFTSEPEYGRAEPEGGNVLARGLGKLDKDGKLELSANLDLKAAKSSMVLMAEATVTGPSQRDVSGANSYVVHRGEFYVGTRAKDRFLHVKDTLKLEIVTVGQDGKAAPGQNVTVEFYRRNWQSVRKAGFGGRYNWVSKPEDKLVARRSVRTGKEAKTEKFVPAEPGSHVVKCLARDRKGNTIASALNLYVSGYGKAGWEMRDDDVVELVRDRPGYQPGDKAEILVKSPYEQCRALVTVEREYILDKFTLELQGNAPVISIPIKSEYLPNVFVSVVLLKGRTEESHKSQATSDMLSEDLAKPGFKIGYVELPVKPDEKRLHVTVSPDRSDYRPGEEVVLDVEVEGSRGSGVLGVGGQGGGVEAEVTLAVIDLGVLKLIGYDTPDPFGVFYASRPLSVVTAESRLNVIGQRNYGEKGENQGGGGAEAGRAYRQKFLETALWLPAVQTDADGHARTRFKLPDNLSTFKIMAVAHSGDRFGSGDSSFRVNQPLLLQAALPMFLRDGDEFEAGAVVFNNTAAKGEVTLVAGVSGTELLGDSVRKVALPPHSSREVRFKYRVGTPVAGDQWPVAGGREAEFRFHCRMGSETDGLKLKLPIRNPVITEAYALYEQTPDSARQPLSLPARARPGFGAVQLTLASSGLVGLEPGLRWLQEYPYECLEQKISRALPFVVGAELVNTFRLSELRGDELRRFVQQIINQVWPCQDARGGFHFWRSENYYEPASPWLSAYCLYFLARAREQGYELDEARIRDARRFLLDLLANPTQEGWHGYNYDCRAATRAYIAYALALWNDDVRGYLPELYAHLDSLALTGQACLLKTLARQGTLAGRDEMMAEITRRFRNMAKYAPATAHFEEEDAERYYWIWSSNARTTAVVLQALLEALGTTEDAEKIVRWLLLERRNGRWRTTQENAWVFDALTTYYRRYEPDAPDFNAKVSLEVKGALKEVMKAHFAGRSLAAQQQSIPLDSVKVLVGDTLTALRFDKQGPGRLYYGVRLTIAPENLKPRTEGLLVRKSITSLDGKPAKDFTRGEFYKITLKVYTPQERLFVALDDPLPAGFEVVNTDFATTSQRLRDRLNRLQRDARERWWGSFDHQEIYSDKYRLFATSLLEGAHTYVYIVKALTSGRFTLPPTKVEEMYTPEVFGLTGQQEIRVRN